MGPSVLTAHVVAGGVAGALHLVREGDGKAGAGACEVGAVALEVLAVGGVVVGALRHWVQRKGGEAGKPAQMHASHFRARIRQ